ncbi:3'(2'),5'-bisphosphate nucleotidase 1-like [Bolinopsis microptera]|uniref:3'(2'),5'-bisphosphate nucleotidase 1-like n=1 Tax=Bolinopsis microptera TaxID=2820187 RepID=UPI0030791CF8
MALMRTLSACVSVAEKAGVVLRDIMASGNLGIVDKGGINNLQTLADKKAQLLIVTSLMKHSPKATIIGEEDDIDYDTEEARSLITMDTSSEVMEHSCPDKLAGINEEDLVIWFLKN